MAGFTQGLGLFHVKCASLPNTPSILHCHSGYFHSLQELGFIFSPHCDEMHFMLIQHTRLSAS